MGQMSNAIQVLVTIGLSAGAAVLGAGCTTGSSPAQANANGVRGDVTDVRPIETASTASYQPPLYDTSTNIPTESQPITADPVAAAPSRRITPMMSATPSVKASGETTHTVRHGETLFSIAKATYGDGKKWKQIVSANPGVSPSKLKVGQVLVMPS